MEISDQPVVTSFEEIWPLEMQGWDEIIRAYRSKHLFHETPWLRFIQQSQNADIRTLKLLGWDHSVLGYFCAAEIRKGLFRLLGSPLQGWTTTFMGPIVNEVQVESLLQVLDRYYQARGVDYVELCHPALPSAAMRAAGYDLDPDVTFLVRIDNESAMWRRLESKSCRYAIRRAIKNGLRVERTTDRIFIQQYYGQLQEVFQRQGLVPTYGYDRIRALWDCLMPAGKLLALRVRLDDEVIATGLFPFDERQIYFWGGASQVRAYHFYPNELLQWNVMLFALEKGIPTYHMGGGGIFKKKFGGTMTTVERWFKPLSPLARLGRIAFKRYFRTRQRLFAYLKRHEIGASED